MASKNVMTISEADQQPGGEPQEGYIPTDQQGTAIRDGAAVCHREIRLCLGREKRPHHSHRAPDIIPKLRGGNKSFDFSRLMMGGLRF